MEQKKCTKCGVVKNLEEFGVSKQTKDGLLTWCRDCTRSYKYENAQKHREERNTRRALRVAQDPDFYKWKKHDEYVQHKSTYKLYEETHKEQIRERNVKYIARTTKERSEKYQQKMQLRGDEVRARRNELRRQAYATDPVYRLQTCMRSRLHSALVGTCKAESSIQLIGCTPTFLHDYIVSMFTPEMTWENIHVDHIRPCASFDLTDPMQQKLCFNYRNLQPLLAMDNMHKHKAWDHKDDEEWMKRFEGSTLMGA